jgi:Histone methylation protein DOT1
VASESSSSRSSSQSSSSSWRQLCELLRNWWREEARENGAAKTLLHLARKLWSFVRESTPEQRRRRYGDVEYDWEHRVNTTSGTVGWKARLMGLFHSPYQATEAHLFQEMMASLPIAFEQFTFVDLGSGKGRTLLMASEYPFRKIIGVELIAELHCAAEENIHQYRSTTRRSLPIEAVLADAREFEFPEQPLVLYLFNPLPERALADVIGRLEKSLVRAPRPVWIVYHNPLLERVLEASTAFVRVGGSEQYSIYSGKSFEVA